MNRNEKISPMNSSPMEKGMQMSFAVENTKDKGDIQFGDQVINSDNIGNSNVHNSISKIKKDLFGEIEVYNYFIKSEKYKKRFR